MAIQDAIHLTTESIWFDQYKFMDAEREYYAKLAGKVVGPAGDIQRSKSPLIEQISQARQQIHQSLTAPPAGGDNISNDLANRMQKLELENAELKQVTNDLKNMVTKLTSRLDALEKKAAPTTSAPAPAPANAAPPPEEEEEEEEDDDLDNMFDSDEEEDEEAERIKAERVAAYTAKKSKKPALIAKSSVLLDVKPWDDETDMAEMQKLVKSIEMDGLVWGQSKLMPIAFGLQKLHINCIVEDEKVSIEELSEKIEEFDDYVQSVDVAAFNKIWSRFLKRFQQLWTSWLWSVIPILLQGSWLSLKDCLYNVENQ